MWKWERETESEIVQLGGSCWIENTEEAKQSTLFKFNIS